MVRALLRIGTNDFAIWNNTYREIADGTLIGAALAAKSTICWRTSSWRWTRSRRQVRRPVRRQPRRSRRHSLVPGGFPTPRGGRSSATSSRRSTAVSKLAVERGVTVVDLNGMGTAWLPLLTPTAICTSVESLSVRRSGDSRTTSCSGTTSISGPLPRDCWPTTSSTT